MKVAEAAKCLQVSRTTLSRVLTGRIRPAFWSGLPMDYGLGHAARKPRPRIRPFRQAA